jgi:hypothetical protein
MIPRPARRLGLHPIKAKTTQIKLVDENIDHPHWIVFADPGTACPDRDQRPR